MAETAEIILESAAAYGSVPSLLGLEGDLLDAAVLGPRLPRGAQKRVRAWGAVSVTDRGMMDDKLI